MHSKRRFVIGDIHGAYKALMQCFKKAGFNREHDMLICLGDICDGWPEVHKVFNELLKVKELIMLLGNHDDWTLDWFVYKKQPEIWLIQGGEATCKSYPKKIPEGHIRLLRDARLYYIMDNKLFVHGGIIPGIVMEKQHRDALIWDRSLVYTAIYNRNLNREMNITGFDEVFVGHTPTINYVHMMPIKACEVYMMDTGAGWPGGMLTLMDIDSKELFQSDVIGRLYPGEKGRLN